MSQSEALESKVHEICPKARRNYRREEKIHIVLEGVRGEESIVEFCRREGIAPICNTAGSRIF
jgi:transposase